MPRRPLRVLLNPKGAAGTDPNVQTCPNGRAPNTVGVLAQAAVRSDRLVAVAEPVHAQNFRSSQVASRTSGQVKLQGRCSNPWHALRRVVSAQIAGQYLGHAPEHGPRVRFEMLWEVFVCIVTSASPHPCRDAKPDANALADRLSCGRLRGCGVAPISVGLLRLSAAGVLSSRKVCDSF